MSYHASHRITQEEIPLAWGEENVDICLICGAMGTCLDDPCGTTYGPQTSDEKKPEGRPSGFGQEGSHTMSSRGGW